MWKMVVKRCVLCWLADCRLAWKTGAPVHWARNISCRNYASHAQLCANTRLTRHPQAGRVTGTGTHLSTLMGSCVHWGLTVSRNTRHSDSLPRKEQSTWRWSHRLLLNWMTSLSSRKKRCFLCTVVLTLVCWTGFTHVCHNATPHRCEFLRCGIRLWTWQGSVRRWRSNWARQLLKLLNLQDLHQLRCCGCAAPAELWVWTRFFLEQGNTTTCLSVTFIYLVAFCWFVIKCNASSSSSLLACTTKST